MSSKLYDTLKFVAQILLPALGTLYFALAGIWGLPSAEQVVGTIVAVDTFLGVLLHIQLTSYVNSGAKYAGTVTLPTSDEDATGNIHFEDVRDLQEKDEVTLKVVKPVH